MPWFAIQKVIGFVGSELWWRIEMESEVQLLSSDVQIVFNPKAGCNEHGVRERKARDDAIDRSKRSQYHVEEGRAESQLGYRFQAKGGYSQVKALTVIVQINGLRVLWKGLE